MEVTGSEDTVLDVTGCVADVADVVAEVIGSSVVVCAEVAETPVTGWEGVAVEID